LAGIPRLFLLLIIFAIPFHAAVRREDLFRTHGRP